MSYTIGSFGFVRWEGVRPQFVKEHILTFRKPGQPGISAQTQGKHGDPFQAQLTAVFTTEALARTAETGYVGLIGAPGQVLVYEGTNYQTEYLHLYLVTNVETVSAKSHPRLIGPTYDYIGGWSLVSSWELIPLA